jgi:hypothetical protein
MTEEFKIDILKSIKNILKNIPKQFRIVLNFLQNSLKGEGSLEFKKKAVQMIEYMI